jgi:PAS domain S-box-containing protein
MSVNRFVQHSESGEPDRGPDSYTAPIWRVDDLGWVAGLDSLVAVLSDCGDDSRLLAASRGFLEAIGVTEAAALGRRLPDFTLRESAMLLQAASTRAARLGEPSRTIITGRTNGGARTRLEVTARPAPGPEGRVVLEARALRLPPAITEQRRDALFDKLSLVNGGLLYVYDVGRPPGHGRRFDLSPLLGYPLGFSGAIGEAVLDIVHPDDHAVAVQHCHGRVDMPDNEFVTVAVRLKHADGQWRWIELRERVFGRTRAGAVRRVVGFASDISERRRLIDSLSLASKSLLVAEAQERRRIARELHDSTAQHLVAIDLTLGRLERRLDGDEEQRAILEDIREALTAAHREVRTFSYLLHPPDLERNGLDSTLRRFCDGFAARTGLQVSLKLDENRPQLQSVGDLALFRVAQEALMNVHHHARAERVELSLRYDGRCVSLLIRDDGVGLHQSDIETLLSEDSGGVGIAGMRARMEQIGGHLDLVPQAGGLLVCATLPLPREARP